MAGPGGCIFVVVGGVDTGAALLMAHNALSQGGSVRAAPNLRGEQEEEEER